MTLFEKISMVADRKNLDLLVNDRDWIVRDAVARQGYGLRKLVNDPNPKVRATVAEQGYGLVQLSEDKDPFVRLTARCEMSDLYREPMKKKVIKIVV